MLTSCVTISKGKKENKNMDFAYIHFSATRARFFQQVPLGYNRPTLNRQQFRPHIHGAQLFLCQKFLLLSDKKTS